MALHIGATPQQVAWFAPWSARLRTVGPLAAVRLGRVPFVELLSPTIVSKGILDVFRAFQRNYDYSRAFRFKDSIDAGTLMLNDAWEGILDACIENDVMLQICHLDRHVPVLGEIAALVGATMHAGVRLDSFSSSRSTAASPIHYDYDSTLVVQVSGRKSWRCYDNRKNASFEYSGYRVNEEDIGPLHLETTLTPGDALFIPAGTLHEAFTTDESSIHLVLSLDPIVSAAVVTSALRGAFHANNAETSASLSSMSDAEMLRRKAEFLFSEMRPEMLLDAYDHYRLWTLCRHARPSVELEPIGPERSACYALRPGAAFKLRKESGATYLDYAAHIPRVALADSWTFSPPSVQFPELLYPVLKTILCQEGRFALKDIDEFLSRESADIIVTSLIRIGLIERSRI